jgi:hypothetical protein
MMNDNVNVASLLRATRKAVMAVRNELNAALEELWAHELAGFGGLSTDRARSVEKHVIESNVIIYNVVTALFAADTGEMPAHVVREFVAKWDKPVSGGEPTNVTDCHPDAWAYIKSDYLRASKPAWPACYRRLLSVAAHQGWAPIPHERTLRRRLEAEGPVTPHAVREFITEWDKPTIGGK